MLKNNSSINSIVLRLSTNRPGSGSLGRPTLDLLNNKRMEQNPFVLFKRAISGKQGLKTGKFSKKPSPSVVCKCERCGGEVFYKKSITKKNFTKCEHCGGDLERNKIFTSSNERLGKVNFVSNFKDLKSSAIKS